MNYDEVLVAVRAQHLTIFGSLRAGHGCLILLGPDEPSYWPRIQSSPEWQDGADDPIDRWSARVIGALASDLGAKAHFPFGKPPAPFLNWAMDSDRAWQSPVGMLVQADAGLLVSYRGALEFPYSIECPTAENPCPPCAAPCKTACPVGALGEQGYDVAACKSHITTDAGADCLQGGCLVRRACPISQNWPRVAEHSAYHMRQFL